FRIQFYYSASPQFSKAAIDSGWGCDLSSGLSIGSSFKCYGEIGGTKLLSPGTWYLFVVADEKNVVPQTDRSASVRISDSGPIMVRADAEPPLGSLESPTDGTTIRDIVTVSGWVLDQFDTKPVVGFLVDGQTVVSTPNRTSRPDVCQVYSTIAN